MRPDPETTAPQRRGSAMKVLILGASGAVGGHLRTALLAAGHQVTSAARNAPHGWARIDAANTDLSDLLREASRHDIVVNASGVENPALGTAVGDSTLIDISASAGFLNQLQLASPQTAMVLGVGLAPGLSTLMVAAVHHVPGDDVDVAIMLGAGEKHGPAAVRWTQRLIGSRLADPPEGRTVMNLHEARTFRTAGRPRRYLRADFPDHVLYGQARGLRVRSYLAFGSPTAATALGILARAPLARGLVAMVPPIGDEGWSIITTNRRTGQSRRARGYNQSKSTALLTARIVDALGGKHVSGTVTVDRLLDFNDLVVEGIEMDY